MQFTYEAKDTLGRTITGSLEADSERTAANRVREMGYYPMRFASAQGSARQVSLPSGQAASYSSQATLAPSRASSGDSLLRAIVYPVYTGVSIKDLALFFRQMAAMLTAGVPLQRTLTSMEEQTAPGPIRTALRSMARHVLAGGAFSDAMKQFPYIFSELQVEFIGCAEQTGGMGAMMSRLADYLDQDHELREMVRKETFHAKITAVAAALLPNVVVLFLSGPEAYVDQTLKPLGVLALCVAGLYVAFRYAMQSSTFRYIFDTFKSYIPYFGQTVRLLSISKFSRALAALYNAGVQLPTGMEISARVSGNQYLSTLIMRAVAAVKSGMGLSEAFRISGVFPPMFVSMLRTGEETGKVDEMLHKVADYYEADGKVRLHQSVQALTTMIFMAVAIWVALIVIRFFMGYASQLQGAM